LTDAWQAPSPPSDSTSLRGLTLGVTLTVGLQALCNLLLTLSSGLLALTSGSEEDPLVLGLSLLAGLVGLGMLGAMLCGLPLWITWHVRAARNLTLLGERLEYTPGWYAGWWFVPFANLVMPYRCMRELLVQSRPQDEPKTEPPLVGLWWASWIGGNILSNVSFRMSAYDEESSALLDLITLPFTLGAAWLYLSYVRQIERDQAERFARMPA
jgi:hypothetical protein